MSTAKIAIVISIFSVIITAFFLGWNIYKKHITIVMLRTAFGLRLKPFVYALRSLGESANDEVVARAAKSAMA